MAKFLMDNVVQSWHAHLPGQGSRRDEYLELVQNELDKKEMEAESYKENIGGFFKGKEEYLAVKYDRYVCYIGSESFGKDLVVTWDLYDPKAMRPKINPSGNPFAMTVAMGMAPGEGAFNDMNRLKGFSAVVLDCAITAAEKIAEEANLKNARIERKSSGMLGAI